MRSKKSKQRPHMKRPVKSQAIVLAKPQPLAAPMQLTSAVVEVEQTIANLERVRRFVSKALNRDLQRETAKLAANKKFTHEQRVKEEIELRNRLEIDWGTIPGVDKPFLKQPGAEKFMFWLNLRPKFQVRERELPGEHLEIVGRVVFYSKKTGEEVFEGPDCSCSTMETNFRYRWAEVDKPPDQECDRLKAIGMGRFKKVRRYAHGKFLKEEWAWFQRVENPNVTDSRNNVRQIGQKRMLVKGIRNMGALSEIFISDPSEWEDLGEPDEQGSPSEDADYTPSGRHVYQADGSSPSGRYQDTQKPPARVAPEAQNAPAGEPPKPRIPQQKPMGKIILTWPASKDGCCYISGDIAKILPVIQNAMVCQWLESKKAYAIPETDAITLHDLVTSRGYAYEEFSAVPATGAPPATPPSQPTAEKPVAPKGAVAVNPLPAAAPSTGSVIKRAVPKMTRKGEVLDMQWGSRSVGTWDKKLWPFIIAGVNEEAEFIMDKDNRYIVGIKRIGKRTFSDGCVPEIQMNEERPTTTGELFR